MGAGNRNSKILFVSEPPSYEEELQKKPYVGEAAKLFEKIINLFELMDWNVEILKYGSKLQKLKQSKSGRKILKWIDNCPNDLFSALTYQGGKDWRETLLKVFSNDQDTVNLIQSFNDQELNDFLNEYNYD